MSYDLALHVKAEGCGKYVKIGEPSQPNPTYNYGKLFRACMDWDYSQCEQDANGEWQLVYYNCLDIIENIQRGIHELKYNRNAYKQYEPEQWGALSGALVALESLEECILHWVNDEEIPLNCLYMTW